MKRTKRYLTTIDFPDNKEGQVWLKTTANEQALEHFVRNKYSHPLSSARSFAI
jgi:hypothetical protein